MSLLLHESPILGYSVIAAGLITYATGMHISIVMIFIILLLFLLYFYRYTPIDLDPINNDTIISPCEGTILNITDRYDYYYIAIFLSPFNKHYQIYPVNGKVIKRQYDKTGEFNVVMNLGKSKNNEKKRHYIKMHNDGILLLTQIAGFLPRMIVSSDDEGKYDAGDYLGMIKFGSRVDLLIPKITPNGSIFVLDISEGESISIGDYIGEYV